LAYATVIFAPLISSLIITLTRAEFIPAVRVDDDTVSFDSCPPDGYVQSGANHYLVVAVALLRHPGRIVLHSHFYKSTDMGRIFSPGLQLDTFSGYCQQPHVVTDNGHIITNYKGNPGPGILPIGIHFLTANLFFFIKYI